MIDPDRLARAIHLDVMRISPDQFLVTGGAQDHIVQAQDGRTWCDCIDSQWKGDGCKHSLLVRLVVGDGDVVKALRTLIPESSRKVAA